MGSVQTTYSAQHARWIEGMVLNMEPSVIVSRECEDVEGLGFGKVGVQGTLDHQVVDSEITVKFVGIAVLDTTRPTGTTCLQATAQTQLQPRLGLHRQAHARKQKTTRLVLHHPRVLRLGHKHIQVPWPHPAEPNTV